MNYYAKRLLKIFTAANSIHLKKARHTYNYLQILDALTKSLHLSSADHAHLFQTQSACLILPESVQRKVAAGILSAGHARALLGLTDSKEIEKLASRIVGEGLSVRATEEIIATHKPTKASTTKRGASTGVSGAGLAAANYWAITLILEYRLRWVKAKERSLLNLQGAKIYSELLI
jgi:hypothetical protein